MSFRVDRRTVAALSEVCPAGEHSAHCGGGPGSPGCVVREVDARRAHVLRGGDAVRLDHVAGVFVVRLQRPVLPAPVAVGRGADLRSALDRVALGCLPAGDHVVALERGDRQEHGQDERAERACGVDVLLDEREMSAEGLNALDVLDRARDVAGEPIEPPAGDTFGLAALDALDRLAQAVAVLGSAGLVLVDVPGRDLHAPVLCPAGDSLSLHGRRDIAGSLAAHSAADSDVSVEAFRFRHRTPDQG